MALTLYILTQGNTPVLKFGPCRYLEDSDLEIIVGYLAEAVKSTGKSVVTFRRRYSNAEYADPTNEEYQPEPSHEYEPGKENALQEFFQSCKDIISGWNDYGSVEIESGSETITYGFVDIDI